MSITSNFPTSKPALNLNFAGSKRLDPRVTFSRSSSGTYVDDDGLIKIAGTNRPRFDHDPVTGVCNGLLVEESRTNLYTYSRDFSANWGINQVTITTNAGIAPDGTNTAALITTNTINSYNTIGQEPTLSTNTNYCYSVFIKLVSGSGTSSRVNFGSSSTQILPVYASWGLQLDNLTETTDGNIPSIKGYQIYPNGWIRMYMVINTSNQTNGLVAIRFGTGGSDSVATFYIWGAQLEQGSFPTSYIPTTSTSVTRAADVAQITGTNFSGWYRQDEGTLFFNGIAREDGDSGLYTTLALVVTGSSTNTPSIGFNVSSTGGNLLGRYNGGSIINGSLPSNSTSLKLAIGVKTNDIAFSRNGGSPITASSATMRSDADRLLIGSGGASGSPANPNGTISRLTYYPQRLTDVQLQQLTR